MKLLFLLATITAQPGQQIQAGQRAQLPGADCSFVIPTGWFGTLADNGVFVLASHSLAGMIMVTWEAGSSEPGLRQYLSQVIPLDEMTQLVPDGRPSKRGKNLQNTFSIQTDQGVMKAYALGRMLPGGMAFGFIGMGPAADLPAFKKRLQGMMKTLKLPSPQARARRAAAYAGKSLQFYHTGGGLADRRRIDLCRNGTFRDSSSSSYYSNTATNSFSASGTGGGSGRWSASGSTITLRAQDGSVESMTLRRVDGKLMINGQRWFLVDGDC